MGKVLVVRKADKTVHRVPLANKPALMAMNNTAPAGQKWSFEEMDEEEAKKLPFIDENYVTGAEAVKKLEEVSKESDAKDEIIRQLKEELAGKSGTISVPKQGQDDLETVISKINAAKSEDEVKTILGTDDRKEVKDAAKKKIASFK